MSELVSASAVAFQAAVAGGLDDIAAAMVETHDLLIRTWGGRRRSGVHWQVYGTHLVAPYLRTTSRYQLRDVAGTLDDG